MREFRPSITRNVESADACGYMAECELIPAKECEKKTNIQSLPLLQQIVNHTEAMTDGTPAKEHHWLQQQMGGFRGSRAQKTKLQSNRMSRSQVALQV